MEHHTLLQTEYILIKVLLFKKDKQTCNLCNL